MIDLSRYRTFVFDCDGVILDSNAIKTDAFYELARPFGEDVARALVDYHKANGGISRFRKIEYLYHTLLGRADHQDDIDRLVLQYGRIVFDKLIRCNLTRGCEEFLKCIPSGSYCIVLSGGSESELRVVFEQKGLALFFDGIFGSPRTKEEILMAQKDAGMLLAPAVFFGDTIYDCQVASAFGMDFIFLSGYSECDEQKIRGSQVLLTIKDFSNLLRGHKESRVL